MLCAQEHRPHGQADENNRGGNEWADAAMRIVDQPGDDWSGHASQTAQTLKQSEDRPLLARISEFGEQRGEGGLPQASTSRVERPPDEEDAQQRTKARLNEAAHAGGNQQRAEDGQAPFAKYFYKWPEKSSLHDNDDHPGE